MLRATPTLKPGIYIILHDIVRVCKSLHFDLALLEIIALHQLIIWWKERVPVSEVSM